MYVRRSYFYLRFNLDNICQIIFVRMNIILVICKKRKEGTSCYICYMYRFLFVTPYIYLNVYI